MNDPKLALGREEKAALLKSAPAQSDPLYVRALEVVRPDEFDLTEHLVWAAFRRVLPFRSVGAMGDLGGLPWEAVEGVLGDEGLSRSERDLWRRLILAMDGAYRSEVSRMMSDHAAARRGRYAH